jgi:hypothetical protein
MTVLALAIAYHAATTRPLFFCDDRKRPTKKGGFHNAARAPENIAALYHSAPGTLIAFPTGEPSGVAVLDIDAIKHPESSAWFWQHAERLQTITIETRSGGWHCYFRHRSGLTCTTALNGIKGVDIRANGGYVIAWGAHGHKTLLDAPVAPWPSWLAPPSRNPPRTPWNPRQTPR